jgi:antitoxin (DNA-binding transcriptional repressor) of toxin-antitoxin stability system
LTSGYSLIFWSYQQSGFERISDMADVVVGTLEAKTHLSKYLSMAESGTVVKIARHGKIVAQIVSAVNPSTSKRPLGFLEHMGTGAWDASFDDELSTEEMGCEGPLL